MNYNWNWGVLFSLSYDGHNSWLMSLLEGFSWTIRTAALAWVIALVLGVTSGMARAIYPRSWGRLITTYVEIVRGIPLLVQLFLWYFVLPEVLPSSIGIWLKQHPDASFLTAVIGLGIFMSARIAQQVKAGLDALPKGLMQAGYSIGLTKLQTYRYVLMPVAVRIIIPPLTSELVNTIKNTSIALAIGLTELTSRARAMQEVTFQVFEAFTVATVIYLVVNFIAAVLMQALERRIAIPGLVTGK